MIRFLDKFRFLQELLSWRPKSELSNSLPVVAVVVVVGGVDVVVVVFVVAVDPLG